MRPKAPTGGGRSQQRMPRLRHPPGQVREIREEERCEIKDADRNAPDAPGRSLVSAGSRRNDGPHDNHEIALQPGMLVV
jgi:hypothetical protein